jgi:hypothetical protein
MFTRLVTALPLQSLDALFASGLARLAPLAKGTACVVCQDRNYPCGTCGCIQGPTCGTLYCDGCGTNEQCPGCYCPPSPIC